MQNLQDLYKIYCKILQVLQEKYLHDLHASCRTAFTGSLPFESIKSQIYNWFQNVKNNQIHREETCKVQ